MKSIAQTIRNPQKFIYKHFYSTAIDKKSGKLNLELSDIPTEEEIEFEVSKCRMTKLNSRDQSPIMMQLLF